MKEKITKNSVDKKEIKRVIDELNKERSGWTSKLIKGTKIRKK